MPRGDKSSYTDKQKREAEHIEQGYEKRGLSEKESERRAWATVNKQDGGGKKSGSGHKKSTAEKKSTSTKNGAEKSATKKSPARNKSSARNSTARKPIQKTSHGKKR